VEDRPFRAASSTLSATAFRPSGATGAEARPLLGEHDAALEAPLFHVIINVFAALNFKTTAPPRPERSRPRLSCSSLVLYGTVFHK
jgi:hypothetical protein